MCEQVPIILKAMARWSVIIARSRHECIRQKTPLNLDDAKRVTGEFVHTYNEQRLHSALGYITPRDMLEGRQQAIHAERDRKLEAARERRAAEREEQGQRAIL
jgi:hypothetical protein